MSNTKNALSSLGYLPHAERNRAPTLLWSKVDPIFDPIRSDPRFVELLRRRLWLLGISADATAVALQAAALAVGSLVLVQPLLVTSLLFALPFSAHLAGRQVSRRDWGWGAVLTAGLAVFLVVGRPSGGVERAPIGDWVPAGLVAGTWLLVCSVAASRQRGARRSILVALVTGMLFCIAAAMAST